MKVRVWKPKHPTRLGFDRLPSSWTCSLRWVLVRVMF